MQLIEHLEVVPETYCIDGIACCFHDMFTGSFSALTLLVSQR